MCSFFDEKKNQIWPEISFNLTLVCVFVCGRVVLQVVLSPGCSHLKGILCGNHLTIGEIVSVRVAHHHETPACPQPHTKCSPHLWERSWQHHICLQSHLLARRYPHTSNLDNLHTSDHSSCNLHSIPTAVGQYHLAASILSTAIVHQWCLEAC